MGNGYVCIQRKVMEGQMGKDLAIRQEYQVFVFVFEVERESMCRSRVGGAEGGGENES